MQLDFKGAIFDADGTLLDSMHVWRNLGELYLLSRGITPEEGLSAGLWPLSYAQGCGYIKTHYGLHESVSQIQEGISRMIEGFYRNEAELKQGVREFLDMLRAKDIHMVIATSGDRELLNAALSRNGIAEYFDEVFTCSELGTDKHDSKIFLACADSLSLAPENIAVFEDVLYAVETAKSAGFITYGVYDASSIHDRQRIIDTADYYIDDWRKFLNEDSINDSRK
ncbi:MAG: HAD family phosphatase [Synergistaceae bacterium]|nr:HAD family phosphatase [Synergistaceae bacterium]